MIENIFFAFWFFAPAGAANVAAFFSGKIPFLMKYSYPVDFYAKIKSKRILGNHKTIRGFISAIIIAIAIVYIQILLFNNFVAIRNLIKLNYNSINPIVLGFLSGFGALFGDALKSFFKRQLKIPPGSSWFPFDQIDYILGGIIFTYFYVPLSLVQYITIFIVWFLIHPLTTLLGFLLKLKEAPL